MYLYLDHVCVSTMYMYHLHHACTLHVQVSLTLIMFAQVYLIHNTLDRRYGFIAYAHVYIDCSKINFCGYKM